MARKASDIPLSKHTLNLFEGDYQRVKDLYPQGDAATIIREVLRAFLDRVEAASSTPPDIGAIDV